MEKFKIPEAQDLVNLAAVVISDKQGIYCKETVTHMASFALFVLERIKDNNDINIPCNKEREGLLYDEDSLEEEDYYEDSFEEQEDDYGDFPFDIDIDQNLN